MDSFYDAPRRPPQSLSREKLVCAPVVPEISVLCPSNGPKNTFTPYNQWRINQNQFLPSNKENYHRQFLSPQNTSYMKKQVRFESPVLQQSVPITYEPDCSKNPQSLAKNFNNNDMPRLGQKPIASFEQMYMANIPSRQLDLSVIDLPKTVPQNVGRESETQKNNVKSDTVEKEPPKTYREFLDRQKNEKQVVFNDSVTDIFNYKRNTTTSGSYYRNDVREDFPQDIGENTVEKPVSSCLNTGQSKSPVIIQPLRTGNQLFEEQNYGIKPTEPKNVLLESRCFKENARNNCVDKNHCFQVLDKRTGPASFEDYSKNSADTVPKTILPPLHGQEHSEPFKQPVEKKDCECLKLKNDNEPSVKDLLKIISQQSHQIAQQNEQLLLLQKQVSALVCKESHEREQKSIESGLAHKGHHADAVQEKCVTSTQNEKYLNDCNRGHILSTIPRNPKNLPKFSIDLTTSFEVSFRRAHPNANFQKNNEFAYRQEPKIQEVTETESVATQSEDHFGKIGKDKTLEDTSMVFREPIRVKEQCPSPEPSIQIDMKDFEESDDENDMTSSEIGATFYRNLMAQVNNILQKAQIQTTEELAQNFRAPNTHNKKLKDRTLHKVKEATLKHLRSIGVDVPPFEDSSASSNSSDESSKSYDQGDISFAVKQLLMKYLPNEHLARISNKKPAYNELVLTPKEKVGAIKNRPEFSFATVQYMKKYNLIANRKDFKQTNAKHVTQNPKILDISKLKQQPKLL